MSEATTTAAAAEAATSLCGGGECKFWLFVGSAVLATLIIAVWIGLRAATEPYPVIVRSYQERGFRDLETGERTPFPRLSDAPTVFLSVVVPAYNEEQRLPTMLDETIAHLQRLHSADPRFTYELLIVSDGSTDGTVATGQLYSGRHGTERVRVLELQPNRGKGGAVRLGVQSARGRLILFADADGATQFDQLDKLLEAMRPHLRGQSNGVDGNATEPDAEAVVVGSRAHLEEKASAERTLFRWVLMKGFHAMVVVFGGVRGVRDTQCGFKLFTRPAARALFAMMHVERWAFDVELLFLARQLRVPVHEVQVVWTEIDGSKVVPVWSWLQMGRDLVVMWLRYTVGAWSLERRAAVDRWGGEDGAAQVEEVPGVEKKEL